MPLKELVERYCIGDARIGWSTRQLARRVFRYLEVACGSKNGDFVHRDAVAFQRWCKGRFNNVTTNIYCAHAKAVFGWNVDSDYLDVNPFRKLKKLKVSPKKIRVYSPKEFQLMMDACPNNRWRSILLLAKTAGLRRGEVLNLKITNVNFESSTLYVESCDSTEQTWRWSPKDYELRLLPLVDKLAKILTQTYESLPEKQPYLCLTPRRYANLIFLKRCGNLKDELRSKPDNNFNRTFRAIMKRAKVKGTFHDLRKTCITEWAEKLAPHEAMSLAGHSNIETTLKYYIAIRQSLVTRARLVATEALTSSSGSSPDNLFGATGLEPAAS